MNSKIDDLVTILEGLKRKLQDYEKALAELQGWAKGLKQATGRAELVFDADTYNLLYERMIWRLKDDVKIVEGVINALHELDFHISRIEWWIRLVLGVDWKASEKDVTKRAKTLGEFYKLLERKKEEWEEEEKIKGKLK